MVFLQVKLSQATITSLVADIYCMDVICIHFYTRRLILFARDDGAHIFCGWHERERNEQAIGAASRFAILIELSPRERAGRLYAQISRDDDTARRYTSRRRVANFPRGGFSIIPLAGHPAPREGKGGTHERRSRARGRVARG